MPQSVDFKTFEALQPAERHLKAGSDCQTLFDQQLTSPPSDSGAHPDARADRFNNFLNFVERAMTNKNKESLSEEIQRDMKTWFPFLEKNMTVFLNIDFHVQQKPAEQKVEPIVPQLIIPKLVFPRPAPRPAPASLSAVRSPSLDSIEKRTNAADIKTEFVPRKLFISGFKSQRDSPKADLFKPDPDAQNKRRESDIGLDSIYLSGLLKKRNGDDIELANTAASRQLTEEVLNDKLVFSQVARIKRFWDGCPLSYPHSFKKLEVATEKTGEQSIVEVADFSKKMIPTMFTEREAEVWESQA